MAQSDALALSPPSREQIYRRNFAFFLADNLLFNIAMSVIGATTVIPDFARRLTDSEILIGLFGALFSVGNTLPQLFIARYIVRHERKKWWFVGPNIPVRFAILSFAGIAFWLGADRPHLILLAFFVCYSIAAFGDGLVGVPWADLAGTSLDRRWRARMFGLTNAGTGLIMLSVAPLIGFVLSERGPQFPNNYALLFGISGALYVLSILPGLFIHELPGSKALARIPSFAEFWPDLGRLLRDDLSFRGFILVRIFTALFMMAAPFYIGYATVQLRLSSEVAVPTLLAMQVGGSVAGALMYTWLGARNNAFYIRMALGGAILLPICALLAGPEGSFAGPMPLYIGFLLSGFATSNLLSGYLNWVVSYAPAERRPIYVGLSNTVAAVVALLVPLVSGTIAQSLGYRSLFVVSLVMAFVAFLIALRYLR